MIKLGRNSPKIIHSSVGNLSAMKVHPPQTGQTPKVHESGVGYLGGVLKP